MKTTHPNRLHKQRGDKLKSWTHTCYPTTDKDKTAIEQQLDDTIKPQKKTPKKKEYEIFVIYDSSNFSHWSEKGWMRRGKYFKETDAIKAFESLQKEKFLGRKWYSNIKIVYKGNILKEYNLEVNSK